MDTTTNTRRSMRLGAIRARLAQALLGATALVGVVSVADFTGTGTGGFRPRKAAEVMNRQPSAALPTAKYLAEAVGATETETVANTAAALASHFEKKGYEISSTLAATIASAAERHGIDLQVAFGLVRAESGFDNRATSHVGAIGLTQLMPRTAAWLRKGTTVRDLRNPETNADIGFGYLRKLVDKYDGSMTLALLAYNRGPGTVDGILKRGGNPDNGYARKVMAM